MRYASFIANVMLTTALACALFHIGTQNLRYNHVHEELNICAEDLVERTWKLDECMHNVELYAEDYRKAIEKTTEYCRG